MNEPLRGFSIQHWHQQAKVKGSEARSQRTSFCRHLQPLPSTKSSLWDTSVFTASRPLKPGLSLREHQAGGNLRHLLAQEMPGCHTPHQTLKHHTLEIRNATSQTIYEESEITEWREGKRHKKRMGGEAQAESVMRGRA